MHSFVKNRPKRGLKVTVLHEKPRKEPRIIENISSLVPLQTRRGKWGDLIYERNGRFWPEYHTECPAMSLELP